MSKGGHRDAEGAAVDMVRMDVASLLLGVRLAVLKKHELKEGRPEQASEMLLSKDPNCGERVTV